MKFILTLALALLPLLQQARAGDACITPTTDVSSNVVLRAEASTTSTALARLQPNEQLPVFGEIPNWLRVTLPTGQEAFVSKRWTHVTDCQRIPDATIESTIGTPASTTADVFEIHLIDVGTGLSIFVRGHDFAVLYDAGSNDDIAKQGKNRVLAYLAQVAPDLHRIDHVILSHPHRDHVELLADVLDKYDVGDVWNSGAFNAICGYRAFIESVAHHPTLRYHTALNDYGAENVKFDEGCSSPSETVALQHASRIDTQPIALGEDASMQFLYIDGSKRSDLNDNSLVLRMALGNHVFLLMGDAGAGGRQLPANPPKPKSVEGILLGCCKAQLKADVLAVGHHGSLTSSRAQFLDVVNAKVFLVSSGPFKYSGVQLPDQEIIAELAQRGVVWRTDVGDTACQSNPDKTGEDADGKAGGCNSVRLRLSPQGIEVAYLPPP